jgi:hypothetical protein
MSSPAVASSTSNNTRSPDTTSSRMNAAIERAIDGDLAGR